MPNTIRFAIDDETQVGEVRRYLHYWLPSATYTPEGVNDVILLSTELATNILKHAGHGVILLNPLDRDIHKGIELIALDSGPGIADLSASMRDGHSSAGSPGTGLGAIGRIATETDIYTGPGKGMAFIARYIPRHAEARTQSQFEVGGVNVPVAGEEVCGDDWSWREGGQDSAIVVVADGLGHGPEAHKASSLATQIFSELQNPLDPDLMQMLHQALRPTRGAAVSIVRANIERERVEFSGVGNVAGMVTNGVDLKRFGNANGTVGQYLRKENIFASPFLADDLVVMHSDGLTSNCSLSDHAGLSMHSCSLIAAVLYRDYCRGRDDASVVVLRRMAEMN